MNRPFRAHVLVCTQEKPDRAPCCGAVGGRRVLETFQTEISQAGLGGEVLVTGCGCLGLCERGPNVVVYPEGRWYTRVQPGEVAGIVRQHLSAGQPLDGREDPNAETIRSEIAAHRTKGKGLKAARAAAGMMPEDLETMFRGFQPSRALLTAIEIDVFTAVAAAAAPAGAGPAGAGAGATAGEVAKRAGAARRGIEVLLDALTALGLLVKSGGGFRNGAAADAFLRAGAPHDSRAALVHLAHLWERWGTLTECVRAGAPSTYRGVAERGPDWTEPFIAAMHRNASFRAPLVAAALDLSDVKRLLDLGGGSGAYAAAFARAKPDLVATVFDLPTVTPLTRRYLEASGAGDRVRTVDGDLRSSDFGAGFDLVFVSAICHMNGPEENVAMFRKSRAALRPCGRIVVHDYILDDDKAGPRSGALFALNMLVGTQNGGTYSAAEYSTWLTEAGFAAPRLVPLPGPTDLVVAVWEPAV